MSPKNDKGNAKSSKVKFRNNKYNHKSKVQQFEEKRRKSALHKYYKELKKSGQNVQGPVGKSDSKEPGNKRRSDWNPYEKAKEELAKRKKEKAEARAQKETQKKERDEALEKYKKEKTRKFVQLKKKTKRGQPVMAGRMELLLEKIQKRAGT
ncbi:thyroid transcription factor 1-associated protein 26 homolog [Thrips palmi]|uniref:Thyroid transcription factor 1-associated protein 26 homolog n=1 Tax=Thrips palmi TaxID=161013 RepID=A0A6P9A1P7_THRPL|nr:thyroid transcription factor 1-associated protein 26 homolog [Thrips palmi]